MRNIIPLLVSVCMWSVAVAQTTITVGPQLDMPANFSKASKVGLGGSAEGVFNVSSASAIRVSAGYSSFKGKFFPEVIYKSASKVQQRLALPNSPTLRVEFEITNSPKFLLNGTKVKPAYNMMGGGSEFMTNDPVGVRLINWQPLR